MAYRESGGEALFEGELVVAGWLSSPLVWGHGDRVVLSTTRRTLTVPRSGLATTVEHRRWGRHGYSCIVLSSDAVKLTLLELATALGVELVPPAPAAAGKRRWRD